MPLSTVPLSLLGTRGKCILLQHSRWKSTSIDYCLDLVKRRDHEGLLASLLLPSSVRQSAIAIRAFNVETSNLTDSVKEKTIGLMRMQFWKDTVESICSGRNAPNHPVAIELERAVRKHELSQSLLIKIVTGRQIFLEQKPFDTLDDVDAYGQDVFSSLHFLILECLRSGGGGENENAKLNGHVRHAANQLGKAQGAVTLLRGVPHNAARRRVYFPLDLMSGQRVSAETVLRGKGEDEGVRNVSEAVAARAQEHLDNCRFRRKYLSRQQRLVMLPAVAVDNYLDALHRAKCNVFDGKLQQRRTPWLPMSLYYHKFKGSY